jgi:uncharacterized protein YbjT (DUF2867 family)
MINILIAGVRGKTGRHVARELVAAPDINLYGASSEPALVKVQGVRPVYLDWADSESVASALDGIDALYVARPEIEDAPERLQELLLGADRLRRVVLLSEMGANSQSRDTWVARVEQAVREHAKSWTILRPTWLSQVFTDERFYLDAIRTDRVLEVPSSGAAVSFIDARDVATVAVAALLDDSHAGNEYTLSGPGAFCLDKVAQMLSAAAGTEIRYVDTSIDNACAAAAEWSEAWFLDVLRDVYERLVANQYAEVTDTVEAVIGRKAVALERFIEEHANIWRATA